jgi:hypothetical protein
VQGSGFRVQSPGFRVCLNTHNVYDDMDAATFPLYTLHPEPAGDQDLGCRVQGSGFRVQGSGCV